MTVELYLDFILSIFSSLNPLLSSPFFEVPLMLIFMVVSISIIKYIMFRWWSSDV